MLNLQKILSIINKYFEIELSELDNLDEKDKIDLDAKLIRYKQILYEILKDFDVTDKEKMFIESVLYTDFLSFLDNIINNNIKKGLFSEKELILCYITLELYKYFENELCGMCFYPGQYIETMIDFEFFINSLNNQSKEAIVNEISKYNDIAIGIDFSDEDQVKLKNKVIDKILKFLNK